MAFVGIARLMAIRTISHTYLYGPYSSCCQLRCSSVGESAWCDRVCRTLVLSWLFGRCLPSTPTIFQFRSVPLCSLTSSSSIIVLSRDTYVSSFFLFFLFVLHCFRIVILFTHTFFSHLGQRGHIKRKGDGADARWQELDQP